MPCRCYQLALWGALAFWGWASNGIADDNQVVIVVGKNSLELERLAASQCQTLLARLSQANVLLGSEVPSADSTVVLLGNPTTNSAIPVKEWPKVSDQGIVLKSITLDGKSVFLLGGGSPVAT